MASPGKGSYPVLSWAFPRIPSTWSLSLHYRTMSLWLTVGVSLPPFQLPLCPMQAPVCCSYQCSLFTPAHTSLALAYPPAGLLISAGHQHASLPPCFSKPKPTSFLLCHFLSLLGFADCSPVVPCPVPPPRGSLPIPSFCPPYYMKILSPHEYLQTCALSPALPLTLLVLIRVSQLLLLFSCPLLPSVTSDPF